MLKLTSTDDEPVYVKWGAVEAVRENVDCTVVVMRSGDEYRVKETSDSVVELLVRFWPDPNRVVTVDDLDAPSYWELRDALPEAQAAYETLGSFVELAEDGAFGELFATCEPDCECTVCVARAELDMMPLCMKK